MLNILTATLRESIADPRHALRLVMKNPYDWPTVMLIGITSVTISVLATQTAVFVTVGGSREVVDMPTFLTANPLAMGAFYTTIYVISIVLATRVGRAFGGTASDLEAASAMTLLQVLAMCVNVAEAGLLIFAPSLALLLTLGALFWLFYVSAVFIDEVHGFDNMLAVMGGIVVTVFGCIICVGLGLAFLSALF
ncbi:MAG: YIP1 family protein [Pseudomonadota bacterium]